MKKNISITICLAFMAYTALAQYKTTGIIERIDPALDQVIDKSS